MRVGSSFSTTASAAGRPARLEPVGAERREHQVHHAAQDSVLVQRGDRIQRGFELVDEAVGVALAVQPGVEPRHEQLDERAGDVGMCGKGLRHIGVAVQRADLAQVAAVRAVQRHLAPREPGEDDEPVEPVVFDRTRQHREERVLEQVADRARRDRVRRNAEPEVLDPPARQPAGLYVVGALVVDGDTHVGEARQHFGERRLRARAIELEVGVLLVSRGETYRERTFRFERLQEDEVRHRLGRVEIVTVGRRERVAPGVQQVERGLFAASP